MIVNNVNNPLDYALVDRIYNDIKMLNECFINCEFVDVSMLVHKSTEIVDSSLCDLIAYEVIDMLSNAGLLVFDNGYKVLPVL